MSKFSLTSRSNDCPICSDVSGKCRSSVDDPNYFQCMTEVGAGKFEVINGLKNIGPTQNGQWAQFVLEAGKPQKTFEERQKDRLQREAEQQAVYQAGLGPDERHAAHSQLIGQLDLHPSDRADAERRGLSQATIESFASIAPWQILSQSIDTRTPGSNGQKLLTPYSGYLVAACDVEGRILGFQIRNRAVAQNDPKYPWLSTTGRPVNLKNSELPLNYAPGSGDDLNMVEGILKPLVAADIHDAKFLGASGGNFASSPEQVRECISALSPDAIVLNPDAGAVKNRQVMRQYSLLNDLVGELGHELKVRWWGQFSKVDGDVDEISRERFEQAQLITWREFWAKNQSQPIDIGRADKPAKKSANAISTVKANDAKVITLKEWKAEQRLKRDTAAYALIAEHYPNCEDWQAVIELGEDDYQERAKAYFYERCGHVLNDMPGAIESGFAEKMERLETARVLSVYDASKGTGKSQAVIIPEALEALARGERSIIFVPTRSLARQLASRVNKTAGERVAVTHRDNGFAKARIVVTCPESAFKFEKQTYENVFIDELNEVGERVQSGQLGNSPKKSFNEFSRLLRTAKHVIIATDDMWRVSLDSIKRIGQFNDDEVQIQRRVRPATEMTIYRYGEFKIWLANIVSEIAAGKKVCIPIGAQVKARLIDRILRANFPSKTGYCIDGKDTNSLLRKEFFGDPTEGTGPDEFLQKRQPSWLLFTPVSNSGTSLETNYFDAQYEYVTPTEGASSAAQRGERNRSAIGREGGLSERHVFFSDFGSPSLEAYGETLVPATWTQTLTETKHAPIKSAVNFAKKIGVDKAIKQLKDETASYLLERVELPRFLAMRAFDVIFREERLLKEWSGYGWEIEAGILTSPGALEIVEGLIDEVQIGIAMTRARALKKARSREDERDLDEVENPLQAVRLKKMQIEDLLGKDFVAGLDPKFFAAWAGEKSRDGFSLGSLGRGQLMGLAIHQPETFQAILNFKAMKLLAGKPDFENDEHWFLPELPAKASDIDIVAIFSKCPAIQEILTGEMTRWNNYTQKVVDGSKFLVRHAKLIAANTRKLSTTGTGLKFSDAVKPTENIRKALEVLGNKTKKKRDSTGKRYNQHSLATAQERIDTANEKLQKLIDESKGDWKRFKAQLEVERANSAQAIGEQIGAQMLKKVAELAHYLEDFAKAQQALQKRHAEPVKPQAEHDEVIQSEIPMRQPDDPLPQLERAG